MDAFSRVRRSGGGGLVRAFAQNTPSSLAEAASQVQPSQSGRGLGTGCLPTRGACPALPLLWDEERGQAGGLRPFPGCGRKGLCSTLTLSSGVGTFLGRGLASSLELSRGLRPGAGVGALNGPLCLHTRSLCGGAHGPTLLPQAPPTQHPGAQPHHWLWFRADTSMPSQGRIHSCAWPRTPRTPLSPSHRERTPWLGGCVPLGPKDRV